MSQEIHRKCRGEHVPNISGDASFGSFRGFFAAECGTWKMKENVKMWGNSMKIADGLKIRNFAESGESGKNTLCFHTCRERSSLIRVRANPYCP